MIFLFLVSAALQYNDPDPYVWMPLYLYGVFTCIQALRRQLSRLLFYAGLAAYLPYMIYLFFDTNGVRTWWQLHNGEGLMQSMKADQPWIEQTREFFGLFLLLMTLMVNRYWLTRRKAAAASRTLAMNH